MSIQTVGSEQMIIVTQFKSKVLQYQKMLYCSTEFEITAKYNFPKTKSFQLHIILILDLSWLFLLKSYPIRNIKQIRLLPFFPISLINHSHYTEQIVLNWSIEILIKWFSRHGDRLLEKGHGKIMKMVKLHDKVTSCPPMSSCFQWGLWKTNGYSLTSSVLLISKNVRKQSPLKIDIF